MQTALRPADRLRRWSREWVAALAVACVLLPEAFAYSQLAGLPPQAGLVAMFAGVCGFALLGSAPVAIVSATSSSATVLAAEIASLGGGTYAALVAGLVMLTGGAFLAAALARLGGVSSFISLPVLRGFALGLALVITLRQFAVLAGVADVPAAFAPALWRVMQSWREWNLPSIAVGLACLGALLVLNARAPMFPTPALVLALGVVLGSSPWAAHWHLTVVGELGWTVQASYGVPQLAPATWFQLAELCFALALILYAESSTSIRTFSRTQRPHPDRDLFALGACNIASAFLGGLPVGAGFSATAVNSATGGRSRATPLAAALLLAVALALLSSWVAAMPQAVLSALVIYALRHSLWPGRLLVFFRWQRDRLVALAAIAAVLALGVLSGLLLAIAFSLAMTLKELSRPRCALLAQLPGRPDFVDAGLHPEAIPVPGVLIARPEGPLFFANVSHVFDQLRSLIANSPQAVRAVVVSLEETPDLDGTSTEELGRFATELAASGIPCRLARVKDPVRALLRKAALADVPPAAYEAWSVDEAVDRLVREGVIAKPGDRG